MVKIIEYIVISLLLFASGCAYGQKYTTRTGNLKFEASVPSFEEVAAESKTASAALDTSNGDVAVLVLMKGFRFKVALMEEHFNESYAETDKYPKATFKGKVEGFDLSKITSEARDFIISGDLTLHGKTQKITDRAKISRAGDVITITGSFDVKPEDFDIKIPQVVSKKIADKVIVSYNLILQK